MGLEPAVGALLRASVARPGIGPSTAEVLDAAAPSDFHGLAAAAEYHGVAGYVHRAVGDSSAVPEVERRRLDAVRRWIAKCHLRHLADIQRIRAALDTAGVPWLIVKGPTLAEPYHGAVELRSYGDLDVVVPGHRLRAALEALEQAGCEVLDRNWTLLRDEMKGEVALQLPSGTELDVHWHLLNERAVRESFGIDMRSVFERAGHVEAGGRLLPTLEPADAVVYVALHAVLSGADRLIWLKDVERMLEHRIATAEAIATRATTWRAALAVRTALSRVERAIGVPAQAAQVRGALPADRPWGGLTDLAWQRAPAELEDGRGSLGRLVARSVRASQTSSARELLRKASLHLRRSGQEPGGHRSIDADDPGSGRYPAGGPEGRDAYLTAVGLSATPGGQW